jgi:glucose uptake protein GlcU
MMGNSFTPEVILAQRDGYSHDQMDYAWSSWVGMVVTTNLVLDLYLLIRGEKVHVSRANVLPGFASGAIWAFGQSGFFKANEELSLTISFPICASLPGMIALTIGIFFFGELKTRRARAFAAVGFLVRHVGVIFIALSKE